MERGEGSAAREPVSARLIVREEAEADIGAAFNWYEDQRAGLGAEFIARLEAALVAVEREPLAYPVVYRNSRRALLRRFPYGVFYIIQGETIEVLACMHFKRNPQRWEMRLR